MDNSGQQSSGGILTVEQISAGGVAVRRTAEGFDAALVLTSAEGRWQLPKGIIDAGETPEAAALREVREEAGLDCRIVEPLEMIEYWFFGSYTGERRRYHKFVHFFLMEYVSGDVADHDQEVTEARWVPLRKAREMLAFKDERRLLEMAVRRIESVF